MAPRLISTQRHTHLQPEYLLRSAKTRVGRHPDNDVVVMLESISRFHAEFENQDDAIMLRDLGSRNGTYLNGHRVQAAVPVRHGDRVQFGNVEFVFRSADLSEEAVKQGTVTNVTLVKSRRLPMELVSSKTLHALADELAGAKTPGGGRSNLVFELYQICLWLRESQREIPEVLPDLLDRILHVVKASRGAVLTRNEAGDLEPIAWLRRKDRRDETSPSIAIPQTITEAAISECRAVLMGDPTSDERFKNSDSIVDLKITSAICVPLVVRKVVTGIIYLDNQGRTNDPLTDTDLAFVGSVAQELAFAMEVRSAAGRVTPSGEQTDRETTDATGLVGSIAGTFDRLAAADDKAIEKMTVALEEGNLAEARAQWRPIRRTVKRIEAMVQEMQEFARPFKPCTTQVQINDVIRDTLDTFAQDAKAKGIDIRANLSSDAGSCMLDEEAIYKTLLGLLLNACDAVSSGGTIEVKSANLPAGGLLVSVSDNGPGLPAEVRGRLFEPFNVGPGSRGTGMSLALAHRYIDAMGGVLEVDSVEGRGTRVDIKFSAAVRSKTAVTY